jgi:hypothetical protein
MSIKCIAYIYIGILATSIAPKSAATFTANPGLINPVDEIRRSQPVM